MVYGKTIVIDLNGISKGPKNLILKCQITNSNKVFCVPKVTLVYFDIFQKYVLKNSLNFF